MDFVFYLKFAVCMAALSGYVGLSVHWICGAGGEEKQRARALAPPAEWRAGLRRKYKKLALIGLPVFIVTGSLMDWMTAVFFAVLMLLATGFARLDAGAYRRQRRLIDAGEKRRRA